MEARRQCPQGQSQKEKYSAQTHIYEVSKDKNQTHSDRENGYQAPMGEGNGNC